MEFGEYGGSDRGSTEVSKENKNYTGGPTEPTHLDFWDFPEAESPTKNKA